MIVNCSPETRWSSTEERRGLGVPAHAVGRARLLRLGGGGHHLPGQASDGDVLADLRARHGSASWPSTSSSERSGSPTGCRRTRAASSAASSARVRVHAEQFESPWFTSRERMSTSGLPTDVMPPPAGGASVQRVGVGAGEPRPDHAGQQGDATARRSCRPCQRRPPRLRGELDLAAAGGEGCGGPRSRRGTRRRRASIRRSEPLSRLRAAMKTNSTPPGTSASPGRASALKAKASAKSEDDTIASPASVAQPTS